MRGWQIPAYPYTGQLNSRAYQGILVKRGFSRKLADLLLDDIRHAIAFFKSHPVSTPLLTAGRSNLLLPPVVRQAAGNSEPTPLRKVRGDQGSDEGSISISPCRLVWR